MDFFDGLLFPAAGIIQSNYFRSHTPIYYGIQYNHQGNLRLKINSEHIASYAEPTCFITHPQAHFQYELYSDGPQEFIYFCFTGARIKQYLDSGLLDLSPVAIPIQHSQQFHGTLLELLRIRQFNRYAETVNLLEKLLLQLHDQQKSDKRFYQSDNIQELLNKISAHPEEKWDFAKEAHKLNISLSHFCRLFRKLTGTSPHHYLIQQRLVRATELLAHSNENIATVAMLAGFGDIFYFSSIFKKYYGVSPLKYRKEFYY